MACLNSVDLIATPGRRHTELFTAASGQGFRVALAAALQTAGWTVVRADTTGVNAGIGFKATSAPSPWCAAGTAPPEYIGKCKVWFYPIAAAAAFAQQQTEFKVMNEAETMVQPTSNILCLPTTNNFFGNYSSYGYMFVGTPYDFKVFMLGVQDRVAGGVSNTKTAILAGVPQIPSFLQTPSGAWPSIGVQESFYLVDASGMRIGATYNDNGFWAAGIKSSNGTFMNNSSGGGTPENRFGWFLAYGTDGGDGSAQSPVSGNWVAGQGTPSTPSTFIGQLWPPVIAWASNPASPTTTKFLKGFLWDAVIANKGYPGDALFRFDDKIFIVFSNNSQGGTTPFRPPGSILLRIK